MRKASKITLIVLALIFVVGIFFYHRLGGFNEPELTIAQAPEYTVAGKAYKGKMTGKEFGSHFEEAEKHLKNNVLAGTVAGVFYNNPEKSNDTIDAFVGIILSDTLRQLPEGYSKRKIPARKVVRAHIKSHLLVSPFIYPDMEEYAEEQKSELLHVPALEIYPGEKEMIIEMPVK